MLYRTDVAAYLEAGVNAVGGQASLLGALLPLSEELPLHVLDATEEVVCRFALVRDAVDWEVLSEPYLIWTLTGLTGQGRVVVLVLFTDARKIAHDLDSKITEELCVADTRALEDLGRAECAGAEDNHLARLDDRLVDLAAGHAVARRYIRDANRLVIRVEEHTRDARIAAEVEVVLNVLDAMHVR